jgi:hypothetical protein
MRLEKEYNENFRWLFSDQLQFYFVFLKENENDKQYIIGPDHSIPIDLLVISTCLVGSFVVIKGGIDGVVSVKNSICFLKENCVVFLMKERKILKIKFYLRIS